MVFNQYWSTLTILTAGIYRAIIQFEILSKRTFSKKPLEFRQIKHMSQNKYPISEKEIGKLSSPLINYALFDQLFIETVHCNLLVDEIITDMD